MSQEKNDPCEDVALPGAFGSDPSLGRPSNEFRCRFSAKSSNGDDVKDPIGDEKKPNGSSPGTAKFKVECVPAAQCRRALPCTIKRRSLSGDKGVAQWAAKIILFDMKGFSMETSIGTAITRHNGALLRSAPTDDLRCKSLPSRLSSLPLISSR